MSTQSAWSLEPIFPCHWETPLELPTRSHLDPRAHQTQPTPPPATQCMDHQTCTPITDIMKALRRSLISWWHLFLGVLGRINRWNISNRSFIASNVLECCIPIVYTCGGYSLVCFYIDFQHFNISACLVKDSHDIPKACHRHAIFQVAENRSELTLLSVARISGVPRTHEEDDAWFGPASTVKISGPNSAVHGIKATPQRYQTSMRYQQLWYCIDMVYLLDIDVISVYQYVA